MDSTTRELEKAVDDTKSKAKVTDALVDDDLSPLSGKPYYHCLVTKSNVKPVYHMVFPVKLQQDLPFKTVPAVIACRGKTWEAVLCVDNKYKRLNVGGWRKFVDDNELKIGDAMFWEVMENDNDMVKFKVQIIKGDFPAELEARMSGETAETPIIVD